MRHNNLSRPSARESVWSLNIPVEHVEKNWWPSGSTNHHFPSTCSTRKKPVAFDFVSLYPPYLHKPKSPAPSAFSSPAHSRSSCSRLPAFLGQSTAVHWPNSSTRGLPSNTSEPGSSAGEAHGADLECWLPKRLLHRESNGIHRVQRRVFATSTDPERVPRDLAYGGQVVPRAVRLPEVDQRNRGTNPHVCQWVHPPSLHLTAAVEVQIEPLWGGGPQLQNEVLVRRPVCGEFGVQIPKRPLVFGKLPLESHLPGEGSATTDGQEEEIR